MLVVVVAAVVLNGVGGGLFRFLVALTAGLKCDPLEARLSDRGCRPSCMSYSRAEAVIVCCAFLAEEKGSAEGQPLKSRQALDSCQFSTTHTHEFIPAYPGLLGLEEQLKRRIDSRTKAQPMTIDCPKGVIIFGMHATTGTDNSQ